MFQNFVDEICLSQYGAYIEGPLIEKDTEPNHQLGGVSLPYNYSNRFGKESTLKLVQDDISKIVAIASGFRPSTGKQRYEMYPLDGTIQSVNSSSQLKKVAPKLADIPVGPSDVDAEVLTEVLSREDIQKIWSRDIDNTITDDQRIALYFYHRLRYPPTHHLLHYTD